MAKNKEYDFLYGLYCHYHKNHLTLKPMENPEKECWEKMGKDLEILEILKKHCDFSLWNDTLNIIPKEEYSTDYDSSIYTSVSIPDEEDRKAIKEWSENENKNNCSFK